MRAGSTYCWANSSLASTTTASTAPAALARSMSLSMPVTRPASTSMATTSASWCSFKYGIMAVVSRPPEYARTMILLT